MLLLFWPSPVIADGADGSPTKFHLPVYLPKQSEHVKGKIKRVARNLRKKSPDDTLSQKQLAKITSWFEQATELEDIQKALILLYDLKNQYLNQALQAAYLELQAYLEQLGQRIINERLRIEQEIDEMLIAMTIG
jgi:hypothetical protein